MPKVLCPFHDDTTPSMELYEEFGHCFSCGAHKPIEEVLRLSGTAPGAVAHLSQRFDKPEDMGPELARISTLPHGNIRGLFLPMDEDSYYVVWDGYPRGAEPYYTRRYFEDKPGRGKYRRPAGHKAPLFWATYKGTEVSWPLVIVEGELNALSIAETVNYTRVCSPGAAANFFSKTGQRYLPEYAPFENISIICDEDEAGARAAIELKSALITHRNSLSTPVDAYVSIYLMRKKKHGGKGDANEILQEEGPEGLKKALTSLLGSPLP